MYAFHLIMDDLGWRIPDPELLSQLRIIILQKRLIKILDRMLVAECGEECLALDALQRPPAASSNGTSPSGPRASGVAICPNRSRMTGTCRDHCEIRQSKP